MPTAILLADQSVMFTRGLQSILRQDLGYTRVNAVHSCHEIAQSIHKYHYTHLITGTDFTDGSSLPLMSSLQAVSPGLQVMLLSSLPACIYSPILKKLRLQAHAPKDSSDLQQLTAEFQIFLNGCYRIDALENMADVSPFRNLSIGELEVLCMLLQDMGTTEIAKRGGKKQNTICTVRSRILEKTGAESVDHLKMIAMFFNPGNSRKTRLHYGPATF